MIWSFILISYLSMFTFGITDNIRGPLFDLIQKTFHVSDSSASFIFAISSLSGFLMSFISMKLFRTKSKKILLLISAMVMMLSILGMSVGNSFTLFLFFTTAFGVSSCLIGLIPNILIPMSSKKEMTQKLLSGLHAMYGVSSLIAPMFVSLMMYWFNNWRIVYAVASLFPLILLVAIVNNKDPRLAKVENISKEEHLQRSKKNKKKQIFLALTLSFCVIAEVLISSRIALYMTRVESRDLYQSSFYLSAFFVALLSGRTLFAFFTPKFSITLQMQFILFVSFLATIGGVLIHPGFFVLTGLTVAPFYPLMMTYLSEEFPLDLDNAVSYVLAIDSLMLAGMHVFVGFVTDIWGLKNAMLCSSTFFIISLALLSFHRFSKIKQPLNLPQNH